MLGIMNAGQEIVDEGNPSLKLTPVAHSAMLVSSIIEGSVMDNAESGKTEFAARYHVPYFEAIEADEKSDMLVRIAYSSSNWNEVVEWLDANTDEVTEFLEWNQRYDVWQGAVITSD